MANVLSLRSPVPGLRVGPVQLRGSVVDLRSTPLTLLVHGYNTSEACAARNFEGFERGLCAAAAGAGGSFWHVHWPGDDPNGLLSRGMYAARVPDAANVGRTLAAWLSANLSPAQEIRFVGHSLGCRVVLETLRELQARPMGERPRIGTVVLLAAAVPQLFCTDAPYPYPRPQDGSRQHVHFSRSDSALGRAFNAGQRAYGEPGEAVGRDGRPRGRWMTTTDTDLEHNEYWGSARVQSDVAGELRGVAVGAPPRGRAVATTQPPRRRVALREIVGRAVRRRSRA